MARNPAAKRRQLENDVRRYGQARPELLEAIRAHPLATANIEKRIADRTERGRKAGELPKELEREAYAGNESATNATLATIKKQFVFLEKKALGIVQSSKARVVRAREQKQARRQGGPLSAVRPGSPTHLVQEQSPSSRWSLFVDETGRPEGNGAEGRFVGVLIPEKTALQALRAGWHATDTTFAEIDRVLQNLLDSRAGILGLTVRALPQFPGDRWVAGVLELVSWVLRLMPISGKTTLSIEVEQFGEHVSGSDWKAAVTGLHRELSEHNPQRARDLEIELKLVAKSQQRFGGYADVVAFTWGSPAGASRERLMKSGLAGSCLLSGDAPSLRSAWDKLSSGVRLSGEEWAGLVGDPDAADPKSAAGTLLGQLHEACRADSALWGRFLETARVHLDSKAVNLRSLGQQVLWLNSAAPEGMQLGAQMRLAWAVARRETLNHVGDVDPSLDAELEELSRRLFDERPELVCLADLDRAVTATNRFDFEAATRSLHRWVDVPPVVPGLQMWGRVQSSLGQHHAFRGELELAQQYFERALEAFARLSDAELSRRERGQTGTYRAIATMDRTDAPLEQVRAHVCEVVPLGHADIARMAGSSDSGSKYAHHLLLRYLVHRGSAEEREAYLAAHDSWGSGEGHPWPLIEAYRAFLLRPRDPAAANERIEQAWELVQDQGPTVWFIGLVLAAIGKAWGAEGCRVDSEIVEKLAVELPKAPFGLLREALARGVDDPLALLRQLLPFNFR